MPFDLLLLDLRKEGNPLAAAEQWMRIEMGRVIPLEDPALFRFALIRISEDHTLWFQKYHHIIIDATGRRLLSARTARRYRALRFGEPLSAMSAATPDEMLDAERHYNNSSAMKLIVATGCNNLRNGPGHFTKPTGRTQSASNLDVMHASPSS